MASSDVVPGAGFTGPGTSWAPILTPSDFSLSDKSDTPGILLQIVIEVVSHPLMFKGPLNGKFTRLGGSIFVIGG
jgi:hypothetical protein